MVAQKRFHDGELVAIQMAFIAGMFSGKSPDPAKLNPYPDPDWRPPPPKSEARVESESAAGWRLLDAFFQG